MLKLTLKVAVMLAALVAPVGSPVVAPAMAEIKIGFQKPVAEACPGRDLLADLSKSDPAAAQKILNEAAAVKNAGPLLWEISPPNGASPSYLLGTIHVTDQAINDLPEPLKKTIRGSKVLVLELKEAANKRTLQIRTMEKTDLVKLPEGKSLWDLVPDEIESKILNHPTVKTYPALELAKLRPWAVGTMVGKPECESLRALTRFMLEQTLAFHAQLSNVPVEGLETIEEQLKVFSVFSQEEEIDYLALSVAPKIPNEDQLATLISLYKSRRIEAMLPLMKRLESDAKTQKLNDKLIAALLGKRNVNMANRAAPLIDKGKAFIAVGALHLAGEDGVVELLRKKGYSLRPVEY
jgi:uncharacterized protein